MLVLRNGGLHLTQRGVHEGQPLTMAGDGYSTSNGKLEACNFGLNSKEMCVICIEDAHRLAMSVPVALGRKHR